jgi:hypothetical protein
MYLFWFSLSRLHGGDKTVKPAEVLVCFFTHVKNGLVCDEVTVFASFCFFPTDTH